MAASTAYRPRPFARMHSQFVTALKTRVGYQRLAFTQHGIAMLSAVLRRKVLGELAARTSALSSGIALADGCLFGVSANDPIVLVLAKGL